MVGIGEPSKTIFMITHARVSTELSAAGAAVPVPEGRGARALPEPEAPGDAVPGAEDHRQVPSAVYKRRTSAIRKGIFIRYFYGAQGDTLFCAFPFVFIYVAFVLSSCFIGWILLTITKEVLTEFMNI